MSVLTKQMDKDFAEMREMIDTYINSYPPGAEKDLRAESIERSLAYIKDHIKWNTRRLYSQE